MRGGGVESLPRGSVAIFAQDRGWGKRGRLLIDIDINKQEKNVEVGRNLLRRRNLNSTTGPLEGNWRLKLYTTLFLFWFVLEGGCWQEEGSGCRSQQNRTERK